MAAAAAAVPMTAWKPKTNPWVIAATVAMAAFMEVLDTSIANVALPYIAGGLGASRDESTWVLTTYLVANAVVLPMGGWASSVIGRKNFFMLCLAHFYRRIVFVRSRAVAGASAALSRHSRSRRRRIAADGAGHHGGLIRAKQARSCVFALRPGGRARAVHRADRRRLADGQLHLALDFLHQHPDRHRCAVPGADGWWRILRI